MEGPEEFQNAYRVQMNGVEQLPVLMSSLWVCAYAAQNDYFVGGMGFLYGVARLLYGWGYPKKRLPGFYLGLGVTMSLMLVAAYKSVAEIIK